jgi:hypothetical protein
MSFFDLVVVRGAAGCRSYSARPLGPASEDAWLLLWVRPPAKSRLKFVSQRERLIRPGDRTQSSKRGLAGGVVYGLVGRATGQARPSPVNNSG